MMSNAVSDQPKPPEELSTLQKVTHNEGWELALSRLEARPEEAKINEKMH